MKPKNKIATKIAGAALAATMMLGGMTVFAAEPGDPMYGDTLTVKAERSHWLVYFDYTGDNKTMTVDETGYYTISFNAQKPGDYPKSLLISSETGECLVDINGPWDSFSLPGIHLEQGVNYNISMYADDFMGFTILQDKGSASFTVTATLEEEPEMPQIVIDEDPVFIDGYFDMTEETEISDEQVPETEETEISDEQIPETVVEEPETVAAVESVIIEEAADSEAEEAKTETPSVFTLTADQMRMQSVKNFLGHMYVEGLGRNISADEMNYWTGKISCDVSATEVATQILTSAEFSEKNLTDEEFVAVLNDVFGIKPTSEVQYDEILNELAQGASRESVIEQYAGTSDWASKCAFFFVNV